MQQANIWDQKRHLAMTFNMSLIDAVNLGALSLK